ncbi:hypothetical protein KDW_43640 [Dictyobacter vulcani]|uniref:Uncharacterized protein n=2 Tax=Dictyobacter vulcani TaxID=2607529 RepID=A0A5J4KST6_9CHLR|nr:hypothetical protein KDW_43640 [Dictyobacter vulcani]
MRPEQEKKPPTPFLSSNTRFTNTLFTLLIVCAMGIWMINTYAGAGKTLWHPLLGAVFTLFAIVYFFRGSQQLRTEQERSSLYAWLTNRYLLLSCCWLCLSFNAWLLWIFTPSLPLAIIHLLLSMGAIAFLLGSILFTTRRSPG